MDLASAMMSINAVKGVEIGTGFKIVEIPGHEASDEMRKGTNGPSFLSNHSGGILGGISTGQPINAKVAIKPTSSILTEKQSVNLRGNNNLIYLDLVKKNRSSLKIRKNKNKIKKKQIKIKRIMRQNSHLKNKSYN